MREPISALQDDTSSNLGETKEYMKLAKKSGLQLIYHIWPCLCVAEPQSTTLLGYGIKRLALLPDVGKTSNRLKKAQEGNWGWGGSE